MIMSDNRLTYDDVREYEHLFKKAPVFLLARFGKRNTNMVSKFESQVLKYLSSLDDNQKNKLRIVLDTEVAELQAILNEAYEKSGIKQYKILANPKNKEFIENNLNEIRKVADKFIK